MWNAAENIQSTTHGAGLLPQNKLRPQATNWKSMYAPIGMRICLHAYIHKYVSVCVLHIADRQAACTMQKGPVLPAVATTGSFSLRLMNKKLKQNSMFFGGGGRL